MCIRDSYYTLEGAHPLFIGIFASAFGVGVLLGSFPVSYTHLDVYKRQLQNRVHLTVRQLSDPQLRNGR